MVFNLPTSQGWEAQLELLERKSDEFPLIVTSLSRDTYHCGMNASCLFQWESEHFYLFEPNSLISDQKMTYCFASLTAGRGY